jgi:hypothetical protein
VQSRILFGNCPLFRGWHLAGTRFKSAASQPLLHHPCKCAYPCSHDRYLTVADLAQRQARAAFRQGDLRASTRHTKMEQILTVELANFNKIEAVRVRKQALNPATIIGGNSNSHIIRCGVRLVGSRRSNSRGGTFGSSSGSEPMATNLRGPLAAFATQPRYSTYVAQDNSGKHQPFFVYAKPVWSTWTQQLQTKQTQHSASMGGFRHGRRARQVAPV